MIRLPSLVTLAILLAYSFGTAQKQSVQQVVALNIIAVAT